MVARCLAGNILLPTPLLGVSGTIMHSESRMKAKKLSFLVGINTGFVWPH